MVVNTKRVRFSRKNTVHELPETPSPTVSLPSLPSSGGPVTPPNLPVVLPGPTPYRFTLPPRPAPKMMYYAHPQLHPTLSSPSPAILYDILHSPSHLSILSRAISPNFPSEPATHPPLSYMLITSPNLPWRIEVRPSRHGVISVSDVLYAIRNTLRANIYDYEYERLPSSDRKHVKRAYEDRYRSFRSSREYEEEKRQGIKRSDFLFGKTRFAGLATTNNPTCWGLITA